MFVGEFGSVGKGSNFELKTHSWRERKKSHVWTEREC